MTMGGVVSSLSATLARLNAIESNFHALNSVAFELDLKQSNVQNQTNSDFKTILDGKINAVENKAEDIKKEENNALPVYEDEAVSNNEENTIENKVQEIEKTSDRQPENISKIENEFSDIQDNPIEADDADDIKTETVNFKPKISLNPKRADIDEIVEKLSSKYGVDSNFVKAIIKQESGFNPNATSKKGAMGLMQLMPKTAESLGVKDAYNPWQNVEGGVKYLKNLLNKYDNNRELALAAYNAGSGAVQKYGGIPPYKETQNYVKSIMSAYNKTKEAKIWLPEALEQ